MPRVRPHLAHVRCTSCAVRACADLRAFRAEQPGIAPALGFWQTEVIPLELHLDGVLPPGSLYQRLVDRLIEPDTRVQAERLGIPGLTIAHHAWFPVIAIGLEKVALYSEAIQSDLEGRTALLSDPAWLLRVGRYLELLTCLGIAEAVRAEGWEILSHDERRFVETAPELAPIRARLDVRTWHSVWALGSIAAPLAALPGGLGNLLLKQRVSCSFLEAHHEDLKAAIALAGPDRGGPRTWCRVFQDAERAVLRTVERAFPELADLPLAWREFVLWRECGDLGVLGRAPRFLAERLGDQDGLFASASRNYRRSMNDVARWSRMRGLMSFSGDECVSRKTSLIETLLSERAARPSVFRGARRSAEITRAAA
jgi:hypothetical protein